MSTCRTWAEDVIAHFHLNPASRYPRICLDLAVNLTDSRLWWLARSFAFMYACLRFIEAYGLWRNRMCQRRSEKVPLGQSRFNSGYVSLRHQHRSCRSAINPT